MTAQRKNKSNSSIEKIVAKVSTSKAMAKNCGLFASEMLGNVNWRNVRTNDHDAYAAFLSHSFQYMQQRQLKKPKISIYSSPEIDAMHDSSDGCSIIEVLGDNKPFTLDSLIGELHARNIEVVRAFHPVFNVKRDANGRLKEILDREPKKGEKVQAESFISLHVHKLNEDQVAGVEAAFSGILGRVKVVVDDWLSMRNRLTRVATRLANNTQKTPINQLNESVQFLRWVGDNNFTLLGMREYKLKGRGKKAELNPIKGTGLGILRSPSLKVLRRGRELVHMTPEVRQFFFGADPIIITKANIKSDVHRRAHMDYIGIKTYDDKGKISGEVRIVGLFTSTAYASAVSNVPIIRQKLDYVLDKTRVSRDSHTGKAITNIVDTFPRDELFQISNAQLVDFTSEIEKLDHSPRVKVLQRVDEFDRFVSLQVYLPQDRYSSDNSDQIGEFLADQLKGRVSAAYPYFPEGPFVRIHYIVGRDEGKTPIRSCAALEAGAEEITRGIDERLRGALSVQHDTGEVDVLANQYSEAFPVGYWEVFGSERLLEDIHTIEEIDVDAPTAVNFYRRKGEPNCNVYVTLYNLSKSIPLSRRVPVFENLGFDVIDESSYEIMPDKGEGQKKKICQHMMKLTSKDGSDVDLQKLKAELVEGFMAVWRGDAADDGYNQLISALGVSWREAAMVRGLGAYLRQINVPFESEYLVQTLLHHRGVVKDLIGLFHCRFDPSQQKPSNAKAKRIAKRIEGRLASIPSLDEDRILRHFLNLIQAGLRTNFYQVEADGSSPETIAIKFDSKMIEGAPEPRPFREIFVYSPKIEGVHLRFGKIARGGLRWSDRHQDFRTEVLGLVKAQLVKNTVIVPTGSKGGFVPKDMPDNPSREEFMACGITAYKRFINALLSITDNLQGKNVIPPQNTVRHDEDDPYLVVAADKGTATFSDIANEISCGRGFWLGDAFASGGSQGYDHKVMGITARGGWEAVKRHFREMNINIQRQPFTTVGVGDMSGDVFGNGMLLSKATKLVAAFDHRDIFIDPNPDPKSSWVERKRLFDMGRCSWQDYNRKLISKGGGVFSRSLKSITLSNEICEALGLSETKVTPNQLMKAILKAQVDLLWFGGIGTYVRAPFESDASVGDRANDELRVSTDELGAKVIGEGANLGITHAARIAFAGDGGKVNTDAIDNSAGVNSSDLEVNIKIALGQAVASGRLTMSERNKVLSSMTEQVANRCLVNNYRQTLTLSLGEQNGLADFGFQQRLMRRLEAKGLMNREIEDLPSDAVISERMEAGHPLSRPELATLVGFAKIDLFDDLMRSDVVEDKYFAPSLATYFPDKMQKPFASEIRNHPLKREIVGTQISNDIINRGGSTMAMRLIEETGRDCGVLAAAFTAAMTVVGLSECFEKIDALDNKIDGKVQLELYHRLQFLTRRKTAWFMVNGDFSKGVGPEVKAYRGGLQKYMKVAYDNLSENRKAVHATELEKMVSNGVPEAVAKELIAVSMRSDGLDAVLAAMRAQVDVAAVSHAQGLLDGQLRIGALVRATEAVPVEDVYDRWALNALVSRIQVAKRALSIELCTGQKNAEQWMDEHQVRLERTATAISEILDGCDVGLSKLIVAVGYVDELAL